MLAILGYLVGVIAVLAILFIFFLICAPYEQKHELAMANLSPDEIPPDAAQVRLSKLNEQYRKGSRILRQFESDELTLSSDATRGDPPPDGLTWDEWHDRVAKDLRTWMLVSSAEVRRLYGINSGVDEYRYTTSTYARTPRYIIEKYEELWRAAFYRLDWMEAIGATKYRVSLQ